MNSVFLLPKWFLTYGLVFELVFALITLAVAIYAFKVYRLTCERKVKNLSLGFLSIFVSYGIWFLLNFIAFYQLSIVDLNRIISLINFAAYAHIFFLINGLVLISYATYLKDNLMAALSILLVAIVSFFLASEKALLFYLISALLSIFIASYYSYIYRKKKKQGILIMIISFFLLSLGTLKLALSTFHTIYPVFGHITLLIAFLLILANLLGVLKNGKKKNKA
jgi:hypothetical protein